MLVIELPLSATLSDLSASHHPLLVPDLPAAFLEPEAVQLLVEKFNIKGADTAHPQQEVQRMMQGQ